MESSLRPCEVLYPLLSLFAIVEHLDTRVLVIIVKSSSSKRTVETKVCRSVHICVGAG
jgi:hypothetical protein